MNDFRTIAYAIAACCFLLAIARAMSKGDQ